MFGIIKKQNMTTQNFYKFAVLAAQNRGYQNCDIIVHTICDKNGTKHIIKLWHNDKKKYIESTLQTNPVSAIQAFKDALDFENKTYSKISEGVEI